MGAFQGTFAIRIPRQGGARENISSDWLQQHQQRETWKNGRRFHEFCVGDGSMWFSIQQTDYDKRKAVYTIKAEGGSYLITTSRSIQSQGSSINANNLRKRNQQGKKTTIRTRKKTETEAAKWSHEKKIQQYKLLLVAWLQHKKPAHIRDMLKKNIWAQKYATGCNPMGGS